MVDSRATWREQKKYKKIKMKVPITCEGHATTLENMLTFESGSNKLVLGIIIQGNNSIRL